MIITYVFFFAIPAILIAYACSYPCLYLIFNKLVSSDDELVYHGGISYVPGVTATVAAFSIGLLVPLLSIIIPIANALSKSLSDAMNTARTRLSDTFYISENSYQTNTSQPLVFGALFVIYGIMIYIILPQAFLSENFSLILFITFIILFTIIFGLALLATNLRGIIEIAMIYIILFWEHKSMKTLIKKNLVAHKASNKLTSILYALTLGCVIFLSIMLNLGIQYFDNRNYAYPKADIVVEGTILPNHVEGIIRSTYSGIVKDIAYVTPTLNA